MELKHPLQLTATQTKKFNEPGMYSYRLKQVDFDGTFEYSNAIQAEILVPNKYNLAQNFPNPFNPSTKISYCIPKAGDVNINIYSWLESLLQLLLMKNRKPALINWNLMPHHLQVVFIFTHSLQVSLQKQTK